MFYKKVLLLRLIKYIIMVIANYLIFDLRVLINPDSTFGEI